MSPRLDTAPAPAAPTLEPPRCTWCRSDAVADIRYLYVRHDGTPWTGKLVQAACRSCLFDELGGIRRDHGLSYSKVIGLDVRPLVGAS